MISQTIQLSRCHFKKIRFPTNILRCAWASLEKAKGILTFRLKYLKFLFHLHPIIFNRVLTRLHTEFKLFYNLSVNFSVGILCGCHSSGTACYCFPGRTHSPNNLLSTLPLRRFSSNARPVLSRLFHIQQSESISGGWI